VIGDDGVPLRARIVFVVAVSIALASNHPGVSFAALPATGVLEIASGVITGLTARFVMARVATAGQIMGTALGLGFAQEYDVHAGESAGIFRTLASTLASLAFVMANGLHALVRGIAAPTSPLALTAGGMQLLAEGGAAMGHGLALAAPVVLAALVGNIGVAVMNRATPSVNIFTIALGAVLVLGTVVLLSSAGNFVVTVSQTAFDATTVLAP
jgi:flagellar biosynthetic protein FliR